MEVRLCREGAERELVDAFCKKVFGPPPGFTGDHHSERARRNPYAVGPPPTAIAIHEGVIVGHLASTPYALWIDGQERLAHWGSGRFVLPEFRGMGLAKQLDACVTKELPLLSGVFVIEAALRAHKADNWVFPGKIVEYIHIVNPRHFLSLMTVDRIDRFLPKNMKSAADFALRMLRKPIGFSIKSIHSLKGIPSKARKGEGFLCVDVEDFDSEVDALWDTAKETFSLTNVRNAEYMNWQFPASKGWKKMVYTESDEVKAWALYTIGTYRNGGPLDGLKALNVIDALWCHTKPDILRDFVRHVLFRGYNEGVDIIMFSGNHPNLAKVLKTCAFIRIPSTVYVAFRSENRSDDFEQLYARSYITRGYADAAGRLGPE